MAGLEQRYLNILKMPRQAIGSIPQLVTQGAFSSGGNDSTVSKGFQIGLYILMAAFLIILILVIVHFYRVYNRLPGIFNFGNDPNALISLGKTIEWQKFWVDSFSDATPTAIASIDYTLLFDVIILEDKDVLQNRPAVLFYRNTTGAPITNFSAILDYNGPKNAANAPNVYAIYNAHKSEIHILIKLMNAERASQRVLVVPVVSQKQYRIAVNIDGKLAEVYKNGTWIQTVMYGSDGSPAGAVDDKFYYTPTDNDKKAARVRNLMLLSPMVTSGIIRNMGTASINLDDLKKDESGNLCAS